MRLSRPASRHLVVVEPFTGQIEFLSDEPAKCAGASALGLPWRQLAHLTDCRVTCLVWTDWYAYERRPGSPFTRAATRPVTKPAPPVILPSVDPDLGPSFRRESIPVRDPEHGTSLFERGPGPMSHGMLAEHDALFWLSICLRDTLIGLAARDPYHAVVLPVWGGLGYAAQLGRVCGLHDALDVPYLVTVTDASARRQRGNEEGEWSREAVGRRQMEDLSLALADGAIAFGPRGIDRASRGRVSNAVQTVLAPRRIETDTLQAIEASASRPHAGPFDFFLHEPQQAAAGVLAALDATAGLVRANVDIRVISAGPDCTFAPMRPHTFRAYWSTRGFVRQLEACGAWLWRDATREGLPVRIHASRFEYLPDVTELTRGSVVLLSAAAAEGIAPDQPVPDEILLGVEPDGAALETTLRRLIDNGPAWADELRRRTCSAVLAGQRGASHVERLETTADLLERAFNGRLPVPPLDEALRLTLDRSRSLRDIAPARATPALPADSLSVIITCYEMGDLVRDAVQSVWAATKRPEEVILVDDGSLDEATAAALASLTDEAQGRDLPLRVVRQDNRGLAAARNRGLAEARSNLISFLDGDDLIDAGFYALGVDLMQRYRALGGVAAWARIFGDDVPSGGWFWNPLQSELPALLEQNSVIVPCMMRTEALRELGGYDDSQRYNYEDWELTIRMLAAGQPVLTIPAYLMRYRVRRSSLLRSMTVEQDEVMRGRMLAKHRDTVSRFAVEVALLGLDRRSRAAADAEPASLIQRFARAVPDFLKSVTAAGGPRT